MSSESESVPRVKKVSHFNAIRKAAAEEMRTRVLGLIQGWLTNSNASDDAKIVLNALAGDIQVIELEKKP